MTRVDSRTHSLMQDGETGAVKKSTPALSQLPTRDAIIMAAIQTGDAIHYGIVIVLLVYMVESYDVAEDPQDVGFYTGLMIAMVSVGNLCTNLMWGVLSDRVGRKPCLFVSILSTSITSLLLGFTRTFPIACGIFVVFGLFHGIPVLIKSTMAELCDRTNQSKGFALLVFCWGLGSIIGPLLGGLLAFPCAKDGMSNVLPRILCAYPYLLPFSFSAAYHLGLCVAVCFLRETVRKKSQNEETDYCATNVENGVDGVNIIDGGNVTNGANEGNVISSDKRIDSFGDSNEHHYFTLPTEVRFSCELADSIVDEETNGHGMENGISDTHEALKLDMKEALTLDVLESGAPVWSGHVRLGEVNNLVVSNSSRPWDVVGVVMLFGFLMFVQFYAETLLAIYSAAPENVGGLGYDPKTMGIVGGITGLCILTFTIIAIPKLARSLGPLHCIRVGFLISIPLWVAAPMVGWLNEGLPSVKFGTLLLLRMVRSCLGCMTFAGSMMVISNSAQAHNMGMVTGLGDTLGALLTIIAPAMSGGLWTVFSIATFMGHEFVPWVVLILMSGTLSGLASMLPERLNVSRI